jgi:hypothetical protein
LGHDPGAIKSELELIQVMVVNTTSGENIEAMRTAKERYLSVSMLATADKSRYGKLTENLENDFTKGHNNYPVMVTEAYNLGNDSVRQV